MDDPLLTDTREGLRTILNILPVAVFVFNRTPSVIFANHAALTFTQKTKEQVLGFASGDVLGCVNRVAAPEGCGFGLNCTVCRLRAVLTDTMETGAPQTKVESAMALDEKGERFLRFSSLPLTGEAAVLLTIEDLTEARRYEQEHVEKEKLTAVLETTGGICHELSQPLQVIMGYSEILLNRSNLDKDTRKVIIAIKKALDTLSGLSHDLSNITRYKTKPYLTSKIIDIKGSSSPSNP